MRTVTGNSGSLKIPQHSICPVTCLSQGGTIRKLLLHMFATELFFAHRVLEQPKPDFENLPSATLDELFAITSNAHAKFTQFLAQSAAEDWTRAEALGFRDWKASKSKMLTQAMLHSVHHRAQMATFLRQQGFKQDWIHDFILSKVME